MKVIRDQRVVQRIPWGPHGIREGLRTGFLQSSLLCDHCVVLSNLILLPRFIQAKNSSQSGML